MNLKIKIPIYTPSRNVIQPKKKPRQFEFTETKRSMQVCLESLHIVSRTRNIKTFTSRYFLAQDHLCNLFDKYEMKEYKDHCQEMILLHNKMFYDQPIEDIVIQILAAPNYYYEERLKELFYFPQLLRLSRDLLNYEMEYIRTMKTRNGKINRAKKLVSGLVDIKSFFYPKNSTPYFDDIYEILDKSREFRDSL